MFHYGSSHSTGGNYITWIATVRPALYQNKNNSWVSWFLSSILLVWFLLLPIQTHMKFKSSLYIFRCYWTKKNQPHTHPPPCWIRYFHIQQNAHLGQWAMTEKEHCCSDMGSRHFSWVEDVWSVMLISLHHPVLLPIYLQASLKSFHLGNCNCLPSHLLLSKCFSLYRGVINSRHLSGL